MVPRAWLSPSMVHIGATLGNYVRCNFLISVSKIDSFAPMRKKEVGSLVQSLKKAAAAHEVVDLSGKVCELNEETTCRMIFGRSSDDRFDLKKLIEEALSLAGAFNLADYVPYLGALDLQVRKFLSIQLYPSLTKSL